jgi:hypothetical protein
MVLTVRPATLGDAEWIGARLRPEDKLEVETATGKPAVEVVPVSFSLSVEAYTVRLTTMGKVEPDPCVLFGLCSHPNVDLGIMWMVCTSEIHKAPFSIAREARFWIEHFQRLFPAGLSNLVDARNGLHLRWLKILGFTERNEQRVNGHKFIQVFRDKDACAIL